MVRARVRRVPALFDILCRQASAGRDFCIVDHGDLHIRTSESPSSMSFRQLRPVTYKGSCDLTHLQFASYRQTWSFRLLLVTLSVCGPCQFSPAETTPNPALRRTSPRTIL